MKSTVRSGLLGMLVLGLALSVVSCGSEVLAFQFYGNTDTPKLMQRSKYDSALTKFSEPTSARFAEEALIANNGASATRAYFPATVKTLGCA
ncbi:hypothetical protein [Streptomyces sp. SID5910]|uniref:hypothetical protein n=1 Tax=Streptomyces sp. SID5910 TaxID=2690312 RepID=UPI00136FBF56|nr:hypothetical protein [Streptomyces sp. SID5910]MYR40764.1 hypothetical protein [Streptomyces sp. SID5910]